ncbi:MAG: ribonuclease HII [Chloroflexi bacterium]|nr:ribonuclease HII [Chloroflexota bacterium]
MTSRGKAFSPPKAPDFSFESALWAQGCLHVAGVDEAGRGALAGPVAAAALIFPSDAALQASLDGVRDSKAMTPAQRERWAGRLPTLALACAVGMASAQEIDLLGILPATRLAVRRALESLSLPPQRLLVDYLTLPEIALPQTSLVKGDARCLSIAAASILAKTARDALLRAMDEVYPCYGFAAHKGYGTAAHLAALNRLGASPIHRQTFKPVALSFTRQHG